ncbi:MAG TPA: GGDEF domain-containing response regulator [Magnetovibrio sp.]
MRFLMVERDEADATRLRGLINDCCTEHILVDHVTSAVSALQLLESRYYDLCFLDFHLDGSNGLDVLKALHNGNTQTAFVFLTNHTNKEAAFEALTLGAMDYLIKERFTGFELAKCIAFSMYLKRRESRLQKEALHDSLTGLGNKGLFEAQLKQAAKRAARDQEKLGLLIIDLDNFKPVNDKYGHKVGDLLLQQVSDRIVKELRASDVVARIGGDEFAAILIKPKSAELIHSIAQKLEKELSTAPYNIGGTIVKVGASVGSSILPDDSTDIEMLFSMADKGMYQRKNTKKAAFKQSRDYLDQVLR